MMSLNFFEKVPDKTPVPEPFKKTLQTSMAAALFKKVLFL